MLNTILTIPSNHGTGDKTCHYVISHYFIVNFIIEDKIMTNFSGKRYRFLKKLFKNNKKHTFIFKQSAKFFLIHRLVKYSVSILHLFRFNLFNNLK